MTGEMQLLSTQQMADFVVDGYLRFDALVPGDINRRALDEMRQLEAERLLPTGVAPPDTGTPLAQCYPPPSAIGDYLRLPEIAGIIHSLVGPDPTFDHDWSHHLVAGHPHPQHLHVDAIVDTQDPVFDIQLFWFPHDVAAGEGGTQFVPGSHLHHTHAAAINAYQHVVGEQYFSGAAGTVMVFHHGMWHAGARNDGANDRWMHKIRLNPSGAQTRQWDTSDLATLQNTPSDHIFARMQPGTVSDTMRRSHPWQGVQTGRHEQLQRSRLWRYLTGDDKYDVDHYLTRVERHEQIGGRS